MTGGRVPAGLFRSLIGVPAVTGRTIYCVPSAGTGARTFLAAHARSRLREHLRVAQLPGREDRLGEACLDDIVVMAAMVGDEIRAEMPRDYALFGHSFGALVMLEVARALQRSGAPTPAVLAVAACAPPHLPGIDRFDEMNPSQIFETLRGLGGLEMKGPSGAQLRSMILPALAADASACTRYLDAPGHGILEAPILAMGGALDPAVPRKRLAGWSRYSIAGAQVKEFAGGHFFPLESDLPLRTVMEWPAVT